MGGYRIELKPQPNTTCTHTYTHNTHTHMHTHNTQIQDTQMHNNTLANIYINTEYRTQIQQSCSTQNRIQHTEQNTEYTEQRTTSTHRTTQSCTHSFDFYHHTYISKNSIT